MYGAVAGGMVGGAALPDAGARARTSRCSRRRCSTCRAATPPSWWASSPGLKLVMPEGPLHAGDRARADPGAQGHRVGDRADDGVARLRAPRSARLRHVVGEVGGLRRLTVGRGAPADDPRHVPERAAAPPTPTGSPRRRRSPPRSAARTPSTSPRRSGPPVPTVSVKIADDQGNEVATGADRRGVHHRADPHGRATGTSPRPPPRRSATAGCTPATSATSTRTASSTSPTARRT